MSEPVEVSRPARDALYRAATLRALVSSGLPGRVFERAVALLVPAQAAPEGLAYWRWVAGRRVRHAARGAGDERAVWALAEARRPEDDDAEWARLGGE